MGAFGVIYCWRYYAGGLQEDYMGRRMAVLTLLIRCGNARPY